MAGFAGGIEAGKAYVTFGADSRPFQQNMKKMRRSLTNLGTTLQSTGFQLFAGGLIAAGPLAEAFRAFAKIDGELSFLAGVVGKTRKEIEGLESTIMQLGESTVFTITQVTEAATALGRAGFSDAAIVSSLDSVLQFAQATRLELGEAAEVVTDTMRAFGLSIKDTDRIVNTLTKTSNSSSQTMQELKESLSFVSAQAAATGLSLEETTTFLGIMANNAQKASIAGTGLQRTLINFQSADKQRVFKRLGIDIRNSEGGLKKLPLLFVELESALFQYDETARNAVFVDLFGRGARAANILSRSFQAGSDVTGEFTTELERFKDSMENAMSAQEIQQQISESAEGTLKRLTSAFEAMKVAVGKGVALSGLAEQFTAMFKGIRGLVTENPQFIAQLAKAVVAITALGVGLLAAGKLIAILATAVGAASAVFGALSTVVGAIAGLPVAAIAALTAGVIGLVSAFDLDAIKAFFGELSDGFAFVADLLLGGDLDLAWKAFTVNMKYLWDRTVQGMINTFTDAFANIYDFVDIGGSQVSDFLFGTDYVGMTDEIRAGAKAMTRDLQETHDKQMQALADERRARRQAAADAKAEAEALKEISDAEAEIEDAKSKRIRGDKTGFEEAEAKAAKKLADEENRLLRTRADQKQRFLELDLARQKNDLAIEKRKEKNIASFKRSLQSPSGADVRSAAGFSPLLQQHQATLVGSVKAVELAIREEALKDRELQVERKGIQHKTHRLLQESAEVNTRLGNHF